MQLSLMTPFLPDKLLSLSKLSNQSLSRLLRVSNADVLVGERGLRDCIFSL